MYVSRNGSIIMKRRASLVEQGNNMLYNYSNFNTQSFFTDNW